MLKVRRRSIELNNKDSNSAKDAYRISNCRNQRYLKPRQIAIVIIKKEHATGDAINNYVGLPEESNKNFS